MTFKEIIIPIIAGSFALLTALLTELLRYYLSTRKTNRSTAIQKPTRDKRGVLAGVRNISLGVVAVALAAALILSSGNRHALKIQITKLPVFMDSKDTSVREIEGEVSGSNVSKLSVVVFAHTDYWYIQPDPRAPFTGIDAAGKWTAQTRYGTEYEALLVQETYHPPDKTDYRPGLGPGVVAVTSSDQK